MICAIPDDQLSLLRDFVGFRIGMNFPKERFCDLERGISSAAEEFGFKDTGSCIQWLITSPLTKKQIEILASNFTVGETYFFRDKRSFEVLEEKILPDLIRLRSNKEKYIRIWSAGCSTGEEAYSIAILLNKMIPDLADWNITILATDINPRFLQKASDGIYSEWSFRETQGWIRKYFKKIKSGFEISPVIKKMVTFSYHNLAEDTYPSLLNNTNAMDIIFCRNVLMYFFPELTKKVIQNLYQSLVEGGQLIVSPVERSHVLFSMFETIDFQGVSIYKKGGFESHMKEDLIQIELTSRPKPELIKGIHPHPIDIVYEPPMVISPYDIRGKEPEQTEEQPYEEALILYEKGRYAQVVEKIGSLASLDNDTKAKTLLARAYANQGILAEALKWCEKAIAADNLSPGCHYLRATILQELGQVEEAMKSLKRALYLDQDFVLAHFGLGNLNKLQGKFRESEKSFENALMLVKRFRQDEILPGSEGVTAGRLSEIITSIKGRREMA
ncbi:MAG: CheR family methyltransferase [Candidatus Methanoperedens sp.]|nr:CheR family methyltransferase [Candidatus Methanoperedens sp.]